MQLDIQSESYLNDPYACFKLFRAEAPVSRIRPHGHWALFRYEDVQWVLKQDKFFTSVLTEQSHDEQDPQFLLYARSLLGMDNPSHATLRQRIAQAFKPRLIQRLEQEIEAICFQLSTSLLIDKPIDFVKSYSMPLPIILITKLLGIDTNRIAEYKKWIDWLLTWRNQPAVHKGADNIRIMHDYFCQLINHKREFPDNDLISSLLEQNLTQGEILALMRLLLVAGTDTTTNLINNLLINLASNPEQLTQLRENPAKIPDAIEETLRFSSPTISLIRKATTNLSIAGVPIKQGEFVLPIVASANHDESHTDNPHLFDINRPKKQHLALGTGIHYCLGTHLAKLQATITLKTILKRFESIQLTQQTLHYLPSFFFRSLCELPLIFSMTKKAPYN